MPLITGRALIEGQSVTQARIMASCIDTSSIDMNDRVITRHGDPVNGPDVVNLRTLQESLLTFRVVLTGNAWASLPLGINDYGTYVLAVSSDVEGAPTACFVVSRNTMMHPASQSRLTSLGGIQETSVIEVTWPLDAELQVRKTGSMYDGQYRVSIIK